jgi:hypothetical protein
MKKGKLRTIHIGGNEYKWLVDKMEVRIYDKNRKLFRVEKSQISSITDYDGYEDNKPDWGSIRPIMVDIWIKCNLLKCL